MSLKMKMNFCSRCLSSIQIMTIVIFCIMLFKFLINSFNLTVVLHVCDVSNHNFLIPLMMAEKGQNKYEVYHCVCVCARAHAHVCVYIYIYIQGVSRLRGITAGGDFLGLCDQKSLYKHVSDFGQLQNYDRLKLRIEGNNY